MIYKTKKIINSFLLLNIEGKYITKNNNIANDIKFLIVKKREIQEKKENFNIYIYTNFVYFIISFIIYILLIIVNMVINYNIENLILLMYISNINHFIKICQTFYNILYFIFLKKINFSLLLT